MRIGALSILLLGAVGALGCAQPQYFLRHCYEQAALRAEIPEPEFARVEAGVEAGERLVLHMCWYKFLEPRGVEGLPSAHLESAQDLFIELPTDAAGRRVNVKEVRVRYSEYRHPKIQETTETATGWVELRRADSGEVTASLEVGVTMRSRWTRWFKGTYAFERREVAAPPEGSAERPGR